METRGNRVTTRQTQRANENDLIGGKTLRQNGLNQRQRTTLGMMNQQAQGAGVGARQLQGGGGAPVVRQTRASQLRNKTNKAAAAAANNGGFIKRQRFIQGGTTQQTSTTSIPTCQPTSSESNEMDQSMEAGESEQRQLEEAAVKELNEKIAKISADDKKSDYLVGDYVESVYKYLNYQEHIYAVRPRYLDNHPSLTSKMRSILVDWLVQVHKRFRLQPETLYLTVSILDRYLQTKETVDKNLMQLIGITSMMLAAKYEEIYSPEIDDYVYICDNAYTSEQILKQELEMFIALDCEVGTPMSLQFLRRYSKTGGVDGRQHAMAKYFLELSMVDYDLMSIKPSIVSAAALCLSMEIIGGETWSDILVHYSGYTSDELEFVICLICRTLYQIEWTKTGQKLAAVKRKYGEAKNFNVATCSELASHREIILERARKAKEMISARQKQ